MNENRWIVVALSDDGDELARVTVAESDVQQAQEIMSEFADWCDVIHASGDAKKKWPGEKWRRPG